MSGLLGWANSPADMPAVDLRALPPAEKVRIIEAMGFTPQRDDHNRDCPAGQYHGGGFRCICVPDATVWAAPADVQRHRHETWDERLAAARNADPE